MSLFLTGARRSAEPADGAYPWSVPALASLENLRFGAPVTFFMGENGSGKSTLIEALAIAAGAIAASAHDLAEDATLAGARRLAAALTLVQTGRARWTTKSRRFSVTSVPDSKRA